MKTVISLALLSIGVVAFICSFCILAIDSMPVWAIYSSAASLILACFGASMLMFGGDDKPIDHKAKFSTGWEDVKGEGVN